MGISNLDNKLIDNLSIDLSTDIAAKLEIQAEIKGMSIHQLVEKIVQDYLESSKEEPTVRVWICTHCKPSITFTSHADYIRHFAEDHKRGKMPKFS